MSIALSVTLPPSKYVRVSLLIFCLVLSMLGTGVLVWADLPKPGAWGLGATIFAASAWVWHVRQKMLQVHHLIILKSGQIYLSVGPAEPRRVRLQASTTLWPLALFLRLQDSEGHNDSVLVMADCVSASELRALLVSCRWSMVKDQPEKNL